MGKEETVWRLTEQDFYTIGKERGLKDEEIDAIISTAKNSFNIPSWAEYVAMFFENEEEDKEFGDTNPSLQARLCFVLANIQAGKEVRILNQFEDEVVDFRVQADDKSDEIIIVLEENYQ